MNNETPDLSSDPLFTTKKNYDDDNGLEPSLIYGLVKEIGGKISCESNPNYGTIITIYFPLASFGK